MATNQMWGGRFEKGNRSDVVAFNASIAFDQRLAKHDLIGSIAHAKMLTHTKILSELDGMQIVGGLEKLQEKLMAGELVFSDTFEDIHMNIEHLLQQEIGDVAGKLHTARSRNDQTATDMHLFMKDEIVTIMSLLDELLEVVVTKAEMNVNTLMAGYTHLQHAQPISYAHYLMAYYEMFTRDRERFQSAYNSADQSPLGAAALAGTTFPIDREYSAQALHFAGNYQNSIDAVSDRDYLLDFLHASATLMMHLSRFCEEIIQWNSYEFGYIEISDEFATGSSIMPQKKNPDVAELIRGKTGRVYGSLFSLLTTLKGLPLAYDKDLQEDKEGVFDTIDTLKACVSLFTDMLASIQVKSDKLQASLKDDFSNATELADYLADKGLPFRQAHQVVGKLVHYGIANNVPLQKMSLTQLQEFEPLIADDVYDVLDPENAVARRISLGSTGFDQVKYQIKQAKETLTQK
ncbi:argininosuccinate lyase [Weissella paramesenteroides]|uniref:argininosuccinate lyase n=1 Tax=Weissella paramesenteroides TaxID=1249 RepID=UPI00123A1B2E|nr:argininosuccinate lyase [Weissella paramesenteroides]KAA8456006.1 argininosuccinate lyase [Weissella paramesenteroides]KAA8457201.1 argininosuccinate lyase [Weissella paramesenteroides]KAA8459843.1 argininosuccinate lyase [Weissella paramesenteroides]KAA8462290.1 argininosuccinate lyase [Weissella paramesenteroides]KAA8463690.1 argininosuccinate lyase [Weissella paramesenteroides]